MFPLLVRTKRSQSKKSSDDLWARWIQFGKIKTAESRPRLSSGSGLDFVSGWYDKYAEFDSETLTNRLTWMRSIALLATPDTSYRSTAAKVHMNFLAEIEEFQTEIRVLSSPVEVLTFNLSLINHCLSLYWSLMNNSPNTRSGSNLIYQKYFLEVFGLMTGHDEIDADTDIMRLKELLYPLAADTSPDTLLQCIVSCTDLLSKMIKFEPRIKNIFGAFFGIYAAELTPQMMADDLSGEIAALPTYYSGYSISRITLSPDGIQEAYQQIQTKAEAIEEVFLEAYRCALSDKIDDHEHSLTQGLEDILKQSAFWKRQFAWSAVPFQISPTITAFFSPPPKGITAQRQALDEAGTRRSVIARVTKIAAESLQRVYPDERRSRETRSLYEMLNACGDMTALQDDPLSYCQWLEGALHRVSQWKLEWMSSDPGPEAGEAGHYFAF